MLCFIFYIRWNRRWKDGLGWCQTFSTPWRDISTSLSLLPSRGQRTNNHYPWLSITVNRSLAVILSSLLCSEMGLGVARMPEENGLESSGVRIMIMPLSASYHHPPIWQGPHWRCSWHSCRPSVCNKIQGWGNLNPVFYLFSTLNRKKFQHHIWDFS